MWLLWKVYFCGNGWKFIKTVDVYASEVSVGMGQLPQNSPSAIDHLISSQIYRQSISIRLMETELISDATLGELGNWENPCDNWPMLLCPYMILAHNMGEESWRDTYSLFMICLVISRTAITQNNSRSPRHARRSVKLEKKPWCYASTAMPRQIKKEGMWKLVLYLLPQRFWNNLLY